MISAVNYFVLIASVAGVFGILNEALENTIDKTKSDKPIGNTAHIIMVDDTFKNKIILNESLRNAVFDVVKDEIENSVNDNPQDTLVNSLHNITLNRTDENNALNNIILDKTSRNIVHNTTPNKSLGTNVHNITPVEFLRNVVHNITTIESLENMVHNTAPSESLRNVVHNITPNESLGSISHSNILNENIVHNITLDGPVTPMVFASLPFLILTPRTELTNAKEGTNTTTAYVARNQSELKKMENRSHTTVNASGQGRFSPPPPGSFNLFHYKQYPWGESKQASSSRMPNLNSTIPESHTNKHPENNKSEILTSLTDSQSPYQKAANIHEYDRPHHLNYNSSAISDFNSRPVSGYYNSNNIADRNSSAISDFNSRPVSGYYNSNNIADRNSSGISDFNRRPMSRYYNTNIPDWNSSRIFDFNNSPVYSSIPGRVSNSMLITLGTVKYRPQWKILTGSNAKVANGDSKFDMESFMRSRPDYTRPLIYFRQYSENETSSRRAQGEVKIAAPDVIPSGGLSDVESHVCVTRCPKSLVAIEVTIENVTRVCTGILLVENFVLTSGSCIPPDWRAWFTSHPGDIKVTSLLQTGSPSITTTKVRYYNSEGRPWTQQTDIVVLKVETGPGFFKRSSFDPSRMWVRDSECYLYVTKEKTDSSVVSFSERKISQQEYAYYYDEDYEEAKSRRFDLIKIRVNNLVSKQNRTVLNMNSSQLLFSVYGKPFHYTTGVVYCSDSFDSLLYGYVQPEPTGLLFESKSTSPSILVLLNLSFMFYDLNRFIFAFHPTMMHLKKNEDYFNVDERTGRDKSSVSRTNLPLVLLVYTLILLFY